MHSLSTDISESPEKQLSGENLECSPSGEPCKSWYLWNSFRSR